MGEGLGRPAAGAGACWGRGASLEGGGVVVRISDMHINSADIVMYFNQADRFESTWTSRRTSFCLNFCL